MITVKKINNKDIVVNCELIQTVEAGHDTVILLTTGEKLVVADGPDEIIRKVIEYRRAVRDAGIQVYVRSEHMPETAGETTDSLG